MTLADFITIMQGMAVYRFDGTADMDVPIRHLNAQGISVPFFPVYIRAHFSGDSVAPDSARMAFTIDHDRGPKYDFDLYVQLEQQGPSQGRADWFWRLPADEVLNWRIPDKSDCKFVWTNPDPGTLIWAIEIGIYPLG